ncbi:unnamed protein product [Echinostoma caproni]|uniref:HYLS1_C domain-containing protein n=1 Tax=Echinostoma caproni TaxID=27848 RepID=A0A183ADR4_9TREM|nr:unnamed protein product [Echinostoma caproni]
MDATVDSSAVPNYSDNFASDVHRDTSLAVNVSLSSSGDCAQPATLSTESSDSKRLDSTSAVIWHDDDDEDNQTNPHQHRMPDDDDDEIDRLVYTDPNRLWANGTVIPSRLTKSPVTARPHPTATSSPYAGPPGHKHSSRKSNTSVGFHDEKENFPEVETRYYVVERYYGPEPRQPLLSRYGQHRQTQN